MTLFSAQRLSDFEHPLEVLLACHERISTTLGALDGLMEHLRSHGCDARVQQAASNVLRYFDSAGRHHHEDEDIDLIPRMRSAASGQNAERIALIAERIAREHADIAATWRDLREYLECLAYGELVGLDRPTLGGFCAAYRLHMRLEEASLIPLARQILTADALAGLGAAMARRRGIR